MLVVTVSSELVNELHGKLQKNVRGKFSVTQVRSGIIPKIRKNALSKIINLFKKRREIILVRADSSVIDGQCYLAAFDAKTHEFMGVRPVVVCEKTHSLDGPVVPNEFRNRGVMSVLTAEAIKNASEAGSQSISTMHLSNKTWAEHLVKYLGGVKYEYGELSVFWSEKELQTPNAKWRDFLLQEKKNSRKTIIKK
ncbi:MAG: hypothetical protein V1817_04640 [Candidatus Micrarchaeota archaeon]